MDAVTTHREALRWAFELLEMVIDDVTPEQAKWIPPGVANPLGAIYAHAICVLDAVPNLLFGKPRLFDTTWAGKTGISEPQPFAELDWARRLKVDLPQTRQYAKAAYENADSLIASISPEDLENEVDMTSQGLDVHSLSWFLSALVTSHINNMAGEISTLKGLQGAKGYPF